MNDIKENDVLKNLNSVDYKFTPDFGLVVSRQYISQNSSQVSYPCGTEKSVPVEFEINISEADYVDGQKRQSVWTWFSSRWIIRNPS